MIPKIHFFNPGHETAILQGSKNYTPPTNVQRMIKELSYLPVWYADSEDFVFTEEISSPHFFSLFPKEFSPFAKLISRKEIEKQKNDLPEMQAAPWGLSPQSHYFFEKLRKKGNLKLSIPEWKEEYTRLTSRVTAAECLDKIRELLPDMDIPASPIFCKDVKDVETHLISRHLPSVLKTPYSSSGRGLLWLSGNKLTAKELAWIEGALSKQGCISIEYTLNKHLDFAMEFYSDGKGNVHYEGLSLFKAEKRGSYSGNVLGEQEYLERFFIENFGNKFQELKNVVEEAIKQIYGNTYIGYLGIDMLVHRKATDGKFAIHPCIEVNMRYTMGMVALRISQKYLAPKAQGIMNITYEKSPEEAYKQHCFMKENYPLEIKEGKIKKGYIALCPVTRDSKYRAYLLI